MEIFLKISSTNQKQAALIQLFAPYKPDKSENLTLEPVVSNQLCGCLGLIEVVVLQYNIEVV